MAVNYWVMNVVIVNEIISKKEKSKAILIEQVRKQFELQLNTEQKQNRELQKRISEMTKGNEEIRKQSEVQLKQIREQYETYKKQTEEQNQKITKQNSELQNNLNDMQKSIEHMSKSNSEMTQSLNEQIKKLGTELTVAQNRSLELERMLEKKKGCMGCFGMLTVFISTIGLGFYAILSIIIL